MYDLVDLIMPSLASRHWYFLTDFRIKPVIKRKMRIPQHHPGDVSFSRHSTLLLTQQGYGDARSNHGDPGTLRSQDLRLRLSPQLDSSPGLGLFDRTLGQGRGASPAIARCVPTAYRELQNCRHLYQMSIFRCCWLAQRQHCQRVLVPHDTCDNRPCPRAQQGIRGWPSLRCDR
jgi:hypothetical protein